MTELIWPNNYNIVDIFLLIGNYITIGNCIVIGNCITIKNCITIGNYIIVENCINKLNQKNILVLVSISIRNNNHD